MDVEAVILHISQMLRELEEWDIRVVYMVARQLYLLRKSLH